MGRIDEALRRAAAAVPATAAVTDQVAADPFTSPWAVDETAAPVPDVGMRPAAPAPPERTLVSRSAVPRRDLPLRDETPQPALPAVAIDGCRERLLTITGGSPLVLEQFRRLAATLIQTQRSGRLKVLIVTSAGPSEGKTLTSVNLALELSESFQRRVLLIDGDLRRPRISEVVEAGGDGLAQAVNAPAHEKVPVIPVTDTLALLPAGPPDPNALSGLSSERMQQLLDEAAEAYDWVIVDTPPVAAAADASLLCAFADATVLVVRARQSQHAAVEQAIDTIGRERIIGVVLNGVDASDVPASGYYTFARARQG